MCPWSTSCNFVTYVQREIESVRVTGDVACAAWILVFKPSAADIMILLDNDVFDVLASLLDVVGHENAGYASTDGQHFDPTVAWIL